MRLVLALGLVPSLACALLVSGCNLGRVAARSSAAVGRSAAPAMEQYFDYEIAGAAMPATLVQLEGMIRSDPTNRFLLLQLTKSYVGYAYGWVEDRVEVLETVDRDFRAAAYERARAQRLYLRAKELGLYQLRLEDEGIDAAIAAGEPALRSYLERTFEDAEDAPALLWTGSAWASAIGASDAGISESVDLPLARALVERSVALDADYAHSAGLGVLGGIEASVFDGDFERARAYFEQGLARTDRHSFALLVNMANTLAVQQEDRALFVALLTEVLSAQDVDPTARLANLVARRRARRYLDQVDRKFP